MNNLNSVKVGDHRLAPRSSAELEIRYNIESLEASLKEKVSNNEFEQTVFAADTPEGDAQVAHFFGDGVYARSLLIPEGTAVVGRLHKQARICIIAQGRCTFTDEFQTRTVEAPWVGEFKAGTKTAVFAHTDTLWVACLGTELKKGMDVVQALTCSNHNEYHALLESIEEKV